MNKDCFTPKVLEADCDNTPITFLTEEIEGVDDTVNPPLNGAHRNTIVKYLMTGHVYMYNSVGIPTLMNEGIVDDELSLTSVNPVQNKVITKALNDEAEARIAADDATNNALQAEQEARISADSQLGNEILEESQQREAADTQLGNEIQEETTARENADAGLEAMIDTKVDKVNGKGLSTNDYTNTDKDIVDGLESKLDQDVLNSIQISSTTSTDVLVLEDGKVNLWTGSTNTQEVPLPVASPTSAGVLNSSTYNAIVNNSNNITNILQSTVAIDNLPEEPTQEELTEKWKTASGQTDLINGAKIYDIANTKNWTYYSNVSLWEPLAAGGESISVNTWTNNAPGIIQGSEEPGQLFAEADGKGSVNGWDTVKSDIANNASNITTLNTRLDSDETAIQNLTNTVNNKQDILSDAQIAATNSGITTTSVEKLNGLADIKSIGSNLTLSKEGELSANAGNDSKSIAIYYPRMYYTDGTQEVININLSETISSTLPVLSSVSSEQWYGIAKIYPDTSRYIITPETKVTVGAHLYPIYVSDASNYNTVAPLRSSITINPEPTILLRFMSVYVGPSSEMVCVLDNVQDPASQNVYSTAEQVVGTWVDGKPIYRRTFNGTAISGLMVSGSSINIKSLTRVEGIIKTRDDQLWALPFHHSEPKKANVFMNTQDKEVRLLVGDYITGQPYTITLEYTKTTD